VRRATRALVAIVAGLAVAALAAPALVVVEDWRRHAAGARGIPEGWKGGQTWGSPAYDFTVVEESPSRALHLRSRGDSSTISREVTVNLRETPILEWRWKAVVLPAGADSRRKETDDQALQLYLSFPRFPRMLRSRIIGYVWDSSAPEGAIVPSQKSSLVTYVVVRSGARDLGRWVTEARDVWEDFRRIWGEDPGTLEAVSIAIDSDDTRSSAEAYVGEIRFRARP
jgi:hypothetical protein